MWAAIAGAWLLAVVAQATGNARLLHHDSLIEGNLPFGLALALFLLAWQAMIAAMMLPSSLPLIRLFRQAAAGQERPRAAMAAFLAGYALIWTLFGWTAFIGDAALHDLVDHTPWLAAHPWLIAGGVLLAAGAFQFTDLKDRCLRQCRNPRAFLLARYDRGPGNALRLGREHALFCVGCCWALMLLMFAVGVANLWWMALLTALMVFEKTARAGRHSVSACGPGPARLGQPRDRPPRMAARRPRWSALRPAQSKRHRQPGTCADVSSGRRPGRVGEAKAFSSAPGRIRTCDHRNKRPFGPFAAGCVSSSSAR